MHLVVRGTRKLSGKGQIIWWELTNRCPEVILIEVVDSTTSPPNSIALKCKIICHPPHTNCCCICFLISVTNLVHQLPISTVFTVLFCHQSHLIMLKMIRSCVYIIAGALEKGSYTLWICLKSKLSPTKDCLDLLKDMKMSTTFSKTWKCELICLPLFPDVVTQSEPMISSICALNPQIKCRIV